MSCVEPRKKIKVTMCAYCNRTYRQRFERIISHNIQCAIVYLVFAFRRQSWPFSNFSANRTTWHHSIITHRLRYAFIILQQWRSILCLLYHLPFAYWSNNWARTNTPARSFFSFSFVISYWDVHDYTSNGKYLRRRKLVILYVRVFFFFRFFSQRLGCIPTEILRVFRILVPSLHSFWMRLCIE